MTADGMTVRQIADWIGATVEGDDSVVVGGFAPVHSAGREDLTFAADARYARQLASSKAGAAIVGDQPESAPMTLLRVENVQQAVASLLEKMLPPERLPDVGVHPSAVVDPSATIADDARIGPGVTIGADSKVGEGSALRAGVRVGADVTIGRNSLLLEGAVICDRCAIGSRVRVGPNSVIGYEGFGYFTDAGVHHRIPHAGNAVIEDDVEIGANSCVDRAKFGSTVVGAGTKVDNLVQIAHNVKVGRGCLLVGQCGIAGSVKMGDYVVLGGHAGVRDNISLGTGVQCAAFSAIAEDVPDGAIVAGVPAIPAREALRTVKAQRRVPELIKRVRELEAKVRKLESADDH